MSLEILKSIWNWFVTNGPKLLIAVAVYEAFRRGVLWLLNRKRHKIDKAVLAVLRADDGVFGKLISEISAEIKTNEKEVLASLLRLEEADRVHAKGKMAGQKWYFGPRSSGDNSRYSLRGRPIG